MKFQRILTVLLCALSTVTAAKAQEDVMVVFDSSGSMWGQIEGKTKVEIARTAFAKISTDWESSGVNAGLVAYGHRRKGDCSDIEVLAVPSDNSTVALSGMVNSLTPKGKTPLSDAVIKAAEALKFTEQKATVILLSDGKETCSADPCAVGEKLENLGVDFTAHVIGFDIIKSEDRAQLKCLADRTGGQYLDAKNADALGQALQKVTQFQEPVVVKEEPTGRTKFQFGLDRQDGTPRPTTVTFFAQKIGEDTKIDLGTLTGAEEIVTGLSVELEYGEWLVSAVGPVGTGEVAVTSAGDKQLTYIPFAAPSGQFALLDDGPFLVNEDIEFRLESLTPLPENATYEVILFPAGATEFNQRINFTYRFGTEQGTKEHKFWASDNTAVGDFEIIISKGSYDLADAIQRFPIKVVSDPALAGPSIAAQKEMDAMGGEEPQMPASKPEGLSAFEHGFEPIWNPSKVDPALLWDVSKEDKFSDDPQFVFTCWDDECAFDYPELDLKAIPVFGGWAVLEPLKWKTGKVNLTLVDRLSGEWIVYNPIRQSDMTTHCVSFLKEGHHSVAEETLPNLDQLCAVKGPIHTWSANLFEAVQGWAIDRNQTLYPDAKPVTKETLFTGGKEVQ